MPEMRRASSTRALLSSGSRGGAFCRGRSLSCAWALPVKSRSANPKTSKAAIQRRAERRSNIILASLAPRRPPGQLRQELRPQSGGQEGDLGHRLRDAIIQSHGHGLPEWDHAALDELFVIGGEGIGGEVQAQEAMRRLVQVSVGRVEAGEEGQTTGAMAALLAQLALRRGLGRFPGVSAAPRQLPRGLAGEMAELADEEDVIAVDEGHHPDGQAHVQHRVAPLRAGGQPPAVLTECELSKVLQRRGAEEVPCAVQGCPRPDIIPVLSCVTCPPTRMWSA